MSPEEVLQILATVLDKVGEVRLTEDDIVRVSETKEISIVFPRESSEIVLSVKDQED